MRLVITAPKGFKGGKIEDGEVIVELPSEAREVFYTVARKLKAEFLSYTKIVQPHHVEVSMEIPSLLPNARMMQLPEGWKLELKE